MTVAAGAGRVQPGRRPAGGLLIAPTVGLAAFMEVLDISIANVALQHIAGSLSASQDESTWVLTSYLITNAIVLPMSGWLASTIGRKRYFLACIAGFSASSLLCGLAPSLGVLIMFRALQGATGGGLQPNAQAILADAFPPERRGMAFAAYGLAVVFAPAIGPTVGGWITDNFSWRWVFLINAPVGIALFLLAARFVHDPPDLEAARQAKLRDGLSIDYIGFGLLVVGMCALQLVLDKGQEDDWFASSIITWSAVLAGVALIAFVLWELVHEDPIVDLRLLGNRNFAIGNLLMFMLGFVLFGSTVLLPLYVQTILGYTATQAGLVLSPGGFAIMLLMPAAGMLVSRVDPRWLITLGLLECAAALYHMTGFNAAVDYGTVAWARVFQSLGLAFLFIPINTVAYVGMPRAKSGYASAIINMARNIGGSFGISLATTVLVRRTQFHQNSLVAHVTPYSDSYSGIVQTLQDSLLGHAGTAAAALHQAQAILYRTVQLQARTLAFLDDFWLLAVIFAGLVPFVLLMRRPQPGAGPRGGH